MSIWPKKKKIFDSASGMSPRGQDFFAAANNTVIAGRVLLEQLTAGDDLDQGHCLALINGGADLTVVDGHGRTALIWAAHKDYSLIVSALLDKGADITARDHMGKTALIATVWWGGVSSATLLLDHGADINVQDKTGSTVLMEAAFNGDLNLVMLLAGRGADLFIKDNNGDTARSLARSGKEDHVADYLEIMETNFLAVRAKKEFEDHVNSGLPLMRDIMPLKQIVIKKPPEAK